MKTIGTISTLIVIAIIIWVAVNWSTIKTAWKYRSQIEAAAEISGSLTDLGVL